MYDEPGTLVLYSVDNRFCFNIDPSVITFFGETPVLRPVGIGLKVTFYNRQTLLIIKPAKLTFNSRLVIGRFLTSLESSFARCYLSDCFLLVTELNNDSGRSDLSQALNVC